MNNYFCATLLRFLVGTTSWDFTASELAGLSTALGQSFEELLGVIWVRDELWHAPEAQR